MPEIGTGPEIGNHAHFPDGGSEGKRASEPQSNRTTEIDPVGGEIFRVARYSDDEKETTKPPFAEIIKDLIAPSEKDKEQVITNPSLVRIARNAMKTRNQTPEGLKGLLKRGDDWLLEEKIPGEKEEEWEILAGVIEVERTRLDLIQKTVAASKENQAAEAMQAAAEAMQTPEDVLRRRLGGKDLETQREIIIPMIETLESSGLDCQDWANSVSVKTIKAMISGKMMRPELARECLVRIALHDSSELILRANGKIRLV